MIIRKALILLLIPCISYALQVGDVVSDGRTVDGNLVSDYDADGEQPVFGDIQNAGNGNVDITWSAVTTDGNGDPVTLLNYELRYKESSDQEYTLIVVPPQFVGHSLTLTTGSYNGYVEAVTDSGYISTGTTITFEVP